MIRRLLNIFSVVSLFLFAVMAVLYIRGDRHSDWFTFQIRSPRLLPGVVPTPLRDLGWSGYYESRSISLVSEDGCIYLLKVTELRGRADPRFDYGDMAQSKTRVFSSMASALAFDASAFGGWTKEYSDFGVGAANKGGGNNNYICRWLKFPIWPVMFALIFLPAMALKTMIKKKLKIGWRTTPTPP